jgi:hypothetical protein
MTSVNNKLILEPYKGGKGLQAQVKSGFATVQQKNKLVGLKLMANAQVRNGDRVLDLPAGATIYFTEEVVYLHQMYHTVLTSDSIVEPFVMGDFGHSVGFGE